MRYAWHSSTFAHPLLYLEQTRLPHQQLFPFDSPVPCSAGHLPPQHKYLWRRRLARKLSIYVFHNRSISPAASDGDFVEPSKAMHVLDTVFDYDILRYTHSCQADAVGSSVHLDRVSSFPKQASERAGARPIARRGTYSYDDILIARISPRSGDEAVGGQSRLPPRHVNGYNLARIQKRQLQFPIPVLWQLVGSIVGVLATAVVYLSDGSVRAPLP